MEAMLASHYKYSLFDLVERDLETFKNLEYNLKNKYSSLDDHILVTEHVELRKFLREHSPYSYEMVLLDLMGPWNREYCEFFDLMFNNKYIHAGSLIVFTYCPYHRFGKSLEERSTIPFSFADLLLKYPQLETIHFNEYNDTRVYTHTMHTVIFKVRGDETMIETNPRFNTYKHLRLQGWKSLGELLNKSNRATAHQVKRLKDAGYKHRLVPYISEDTGATGSNITLFPPEIHTQIIQHVTVADHDHTVDMMSHLATRARELSSRIPQETPVVEIEKPQTTEAAGPSSVNSLEFIQNHDPKTFKMLMLLKAMKELDLL